MSAALALLASVPSLAGLAFGVCLVTSTDHVYHEWSGKLSERLAELYASRQLPPAFYALTASAPTLGAVGLGFLSPSHRHEAWSAAIGAYLSDRGTVHGVIEHLALGRGYPSMPGTKRSSLLLMAAILLALSLYQAGMGVSFLWALIGAAPFAALPSLQRALARNNSKGELP